MLTQIHPDAFFALPDGFATWDLLLLPLVKKLATMLRSLGSYTAYLWFSKITSWYRGRSEQQLHASGNRRDKERIAPDKAYSLRGLHPFSL